MSLPIMTTREDVDAIVAYLKTKPVGVTIAEAQAAVGSKLLDGRKLSAYEAWGVILHDGEKIKLSNSVRELSWVSAEKNAFFANVIRQTRPYLVAMEWAFHRRFDQLASADLAAHWHDHCRDDIGTDNETTIGNQVACFFSLAEAAGLGCRIIGRRGQQTRLDLSKDALGRFISEANGDDMLDVSDQVTDTTKDNGATTEIDGGGTDGSGHFVGNMDQQVNEPSYIQSGTKSSPDPSVHIDVQIHIDANATPEQIDQIFASMARHLYSRG